MLNHLISDLRLNLRILLRLPGFWVPTVLFPAMLYSFFGANSAGPEVFKSYAMASFAIYAVVGVGFYQFGVTVAQDRESPFTQWQRVVPGSHVTPWIARVLVAMGFVAIAVVFVGLAGKFVGGVTLDAGTYARLGAACLIAAVPAVLMGTALGSLASSRAAVPLANLIFLPLAYLGGLWVPPVALPRAIDTISHYTPTRAMGELAWAALDGRAVPSEFVVMLLVWTLVSGAVTALAQRRHAKALFG